MELEEMKNEAREIAKNGTKEQKENFVDFICSAIRWHSMQCSFAGGKKNLEELADAKEVYQAYLEVIENETK